MIIDENMIKWSLATTNEQKHKSKGANANDLKCINELKYKDFNDIENKLIVLTNWKIEMQCNYWALYFSNMFKF